MSKFKVGDRVKVRSGAELKYPEQMRLVGTVVETSDIPGYGDAIRIHWPNNDEPEAAFSQAALFALSDD
jgi:hypothetical protein